MAESLKDVLTVIEQNGKYLLDSGGYNTHLNVDGTIFAKTSKLQLEKKPRTIAVGTDMREITHMTRTINGVEEKMDKESYDQTRALLEEECKDEEGDYISLEHEYKYRKAMSGWVQVVKDSVAWKEREFQILHLPSTDNPCITGYLSREKLENPVVNYQRYKHVIVVDAFNRLGIDILNVPVSSRYSGIEKTLTREESSWNDDKLYAVRYDDTTIISSNDFKRDEERVTLDKAIELYEKDVQRVIDLYNAVYAKHNAKLSEKDVPQLGLYLNAIEAQVVALPTYVKARLDKESIIAQIKKAKKLLGV